MEKSKVTLVNKKINYTEMTVYSDLVVRQAKTCLMSLGIKKTDRVYKRRPRKCTRCMGGDIISLEVLGAYESTLFWECNECEQLFCKFTHQETEQHLQKGKKYWTNRNDWIPPLEENLN